MITVKDIKDLLKGLPDDTPVEINSVWDENGEELTPSACVDAYYHEIDKKVYLTPEFISQG